jgi:phosphoribosylanthranilate isomerase
MVKVKICGITNLEDAIASVGAGCDALGFIFYKKSPRYIMPQQAKKIVRLLPSRITKIGIFVNAKEKTIDNIAKMCKLDILQFHGDESVEFCKKLKGYKIIKAVRIKDKNSLNGLYKYPVWGFMFDSYKKNLFGGTGNKFDWKIIKNIKLKKRNIFLSGGLDAKNVKEAIRLIKPDWVDVSSAVETRPGKKDYKKVKKFIETVRR